jgi:hypothetical protein
MPVRPTRLLLATRTLLAPLLLLAPFAQSQKTPAKPAEAPPTPDVLVFSNGDQLTGKLQSATGGSVVFASDMAGSLTVSFDKIKEIRSGSNSAEFAVLKKGVLVNKNTPAPEGTVTLADGNVLVHPGFPAANADSTSTFASVPAKDVSYIVAKNEFDHQVSGKHGFKEGWNGTLTGGATLVRSTTTATTLTAALNLIRALPTVPWLPAKNRTTLDVVETYGKDTSPGSIPQTVPPTPSVTTLSSIFHADAERDEYFSPRFYALADTAFDHNYAQGLQFQQIYGGGVGWTPIKSAKQQLDVKIDIHYEEQKFITNPVNGSVVATVPSMNIIGSTIFEGYHRNLPRKLVFTETANILPAFNDTNAYSANLTAALAIPVFKRLSATVSTTDNYLNDPSPGYNKNSYQFVTGVTYALK